MTDAKGLAADVEELIRASAANTGERISAARDRAQKTLAQAAVGAIGGASPSI